MENWGGTPYMIKVTRGVWGGLFIICCLVPSI